MLVSIDTLRPDHMSVYNYPRKTTPGLEAFATEAIVFDDAVSTSSWTLPAHASLLTSTYPSAHGAVNLNVGLARSWPNLATVLRESGFKTQAMVTHVYLAPEYVSMKDSIAINTCPRRARRSSPIARCVSCRLWATAISSFSFTTTTHIGITTRRPLRQRVRSIL